MSTLSSHIRRWKARFSGVADATDLATYEPVLAAVNAREPALAALSEADLRTLAGSLRVRARAGVAPEDLLVDAYALVREGARRVLGLRPFDVQVLAGLVLYRGAVAEMQTGEGKTLSAVFPATLHALMGQGVHVLTFNDYLAERDAEWMGPLYRFLGLSVDFIREGLPGPARRAAYAADVTYATAREAGFDYLRDRLCFAPGDQVHRPFHAALVDEADSILIDEARVPLVIAGQQPGEAGGVQRMAEIVRSLRPETDFTTDDGARNVFLTDAGLHRVEALLGCDNLHAPEHYQLLTDLNGALHARVLLQRDVDYIVRDGRVELVDAFTGRVAEKRHWPDGLQAAIEAKERLRLQPEGRTLGTITVQHFLQLYPRLAGMTATADPRELRAFYGLDVVTIPPNRPCIRVDHPDVVFSHEEAGTRALIAEIAQVHATGRPVLVGTGSVAESEALAARLQEHGILCRVLNARNDALEARIIARAGAVGAVTISTNMAGRGTDIRLGGEQERDRDRVVALGGLYVIGTTRHESRRIDRQLRGRAGRQGDPGASRFFVALDDPMLVRAGIGDLIPERVRPPRGEAPLDHPVIRYEIDRAQRIVEGRHFEIRKTLMTYASFVEAQRRAVARRRAAVLAGGVPDEEGVDAIVRFLQAEAPEGYARHLAVCGEGVLRDVVRRIVLYHLDLHWSLHLETVGRIREGIHLVSLGGERPYYEFQKLAAAAFDEMEARIDQDILETFETVRVTRDGLDLDREGLRGPSATWTYLVNDDAITDDLTRLVAGHGHTAFAAAAVLMTGPLLLAWSLYRYVKNRMWREPD